MKKLLAGLLALGSLSVLAQTTRTPKEITLNHRVLNTCNNDSCYFDIFNMKQEYGYGLALEFGNDHGENIFGTIQVVDEFAKIVDLGTGSCTDLKSGSDYNRKTQAWDWLNYSEAWNQLNLNGTQDVRAKEGHCYLMYKTSSDMQAVVAFHVKALVKDQFVIIDELEIFKKAKISNLKL